MWFWRFLLVNRSRMIAEVIIAFLEIVSPKFMYWDSNKNIELVFIRQNDLFNLSATVIYVWYTLTFWVIVMATSNIFMIHRPISVRTLQISKRMSKKCSLTTALIDGIKTLASQNHMFRVLFTHSNNIFDVGISGIQKLKIRNGNNMLFML